MKDVGIEEYDINSQPGGRGIGIAQRISRNWQMYVETCSVWELETWRRVMFFEEVSGVEVMEDLSDYKIQQDHGQFNM